MMKVPRRAGEGPKGEPGEPGSGGSSGGAETEVGDTPPVDPVDGQLWWNTIDGNLYVYYEEPGIDGTSQWVPASPGQQGLKVNQVLLAGKM